MRKKKDYEMPKGKKNDFVREEGVEIINVRIRNQVQKVTKQN